MKEEELRYFENLCNLLYGPSSQEEKQRADTELTNITKSPSFANDIEYILKYSQNNYALICLGLSLKHVIIDNWVSFSVDRRLEMRNLLIDFIRDCGPKLNNLVLRSLSSAACLITKLSWISDKRHRSLFESIESIIDMGSTYSIIGLDMMGDFVEQMNTPSSMDNTEHRRTATQFISENLLDIFQFAINVLNQIHKGDPLYNDTNFRNAVLSSVVNILSRCLQFDFQGCTVDDGSDEIWVLQLPINWEGLVCDSNQLNILFDIYHSVESPLTQPVLEIIMLFASIRRSLFRDAGARLNFLHVLIGGVQKCLETGHGLNDEDTYNMMCQLLGRLKSNFQLSELMRTPEYASCFSLIANFTCTSLRDWDACSNSINFLLTLWARMACANRYVQLTDAMIPNSLVLHQLLPKIVEAYVEGRLNQLTNDSGNMNPLDDPEGLHEEMTQFPQIVRFVYNESGAYLLKKMEEMMDEYEKIMTIMSNGQTSDELKDTAMNLENGLALMIHIISSVISGQSFMLVQVTKNHNQFDAQLCRCVFLLNKVVTERQERASMPYRCDPHLEVAFISFLLVFRQTFINDQKSFAIVREFETATNGIPPRAAAYRDFFIQIGFSDNIEVLRLIWDEICRNLRNWCDNEMVITQSLNLLLDISNGYEFSKMLLQIDDVTYVLQHHTEQEFPFLLNPSYSHLRTIYYQGLTNLILLEAAPGRLEILMKPIMDRINRLHTIKRFSNEDCMTIVNVFRDCRGVVNSCTSKRSFNIFFELLYPHAFEVMQQALRERGDEEEIVSSIMKFLSSLVLNKESRIDYCNDLANGVTLFRETSNVIRVYGQLLLDTFKSFTQCPAFVYKGICQLFHVMERFLKGNYIPFGVFELYNDMCLQDLLQMFIQIVIRTPFDQLSQWPKYERAVFIFLDLLFSNHLSTVSMIDNQSFITIMDSICHGVTSFNNDVVRCSARILDTIATYLYLNQCKNTSTITNIKRIIVAQPDFWEVVMTSVLNAFIFGNNTTSWDLSRPIFSIYLVKREAFDAYLNIACANQQPDVVQKLVNDTKALTSGIDYAMGARSRDEFSKKAMTWRRQFLSYMQL